MSVGCIEKERALIAGKLRYADTTYIRC